ncbi:MAG: hypothetical protein ACJASJ_001646 [Candidatus Azotimanducaceae bacterium]|jgi:hypothetical protein|tara:strand:+ start:943 stop:1128 length:186 start_codon:yes stop_codon:yes gene_type:complete
MLDGSFGFLKKKRESLNFPFSEHGLFIIIVLAWRLFLLLATKRLNYRRMRCIREGPIDPAK